MSDGLLLETLIFLITLCAKLAHTACHLGAYCLALITVIARDSNPGTIFNSGISGLSFLNPGIPGLIPVLQYHHES